MEAGNINRYTYRGEEGEVIPRGATHIFVVANVIRARAFARHPNIEEVICSEDVEKIEYRAFRNCGHLKKVVMPNVTVVEDSAFVYCPALTDVECDKLETIEMHAFSCCTSLSSINMPSAREVKELAFQRCKALTNAIFSDKLERIERLAFVRCTSLERITIPLKGGIITSDIIFMGCRRLKHMDLVEGEALRETVVALYFEDWRIDMNDKIDSIKQTLKKWGGQGQGQEEAISSWIELVLKNINHYKKKHRRVLKVPAAALQHSLPRDILMNNILPFLELPSFTFG